MKKNLKKVISAVIALALSASTFASVSFAKSFTDVASTASYAEAVDVLSALGIINGYEDGTFGPDKTIKRSEAAKIIVAMVNKLAAAEGRMGATEFTDVASDHWASGFINVGVTEGFINGMGGGIFKPDGEVTYNQVVKMIVSCLGYEEYAQFYGGYPTGYVSIADSEGITKGCSMNGDSAATRGVVAQLVYNALKTPIIEPKGMTYSASAGGFVPNIEKQDGEESTYYKTLLTEKFDAYVVEGKVYNTFRTEDSYAQNEVDFQVEKSEKYNNDEICTIATTGKVTGLSMTKVDTGDTAAADYINTYSIAIVQQDEDDDWTILSFIPSGKNKTVTLDVSLFDDDEYVATEVFDGSDAVIDKAPLRFFASEDATRSTKYQLDKDVKLYVNGVEVTFSTAKTAKSMIDKYVINNEAGTIELVDAYSANGAADGKYDYIYVDYFATAKVDAVSSKKITFADKVIFDRSSLTLDKEDNEDLEYHIYYNDEEIAITDLKKDDIISIAYDIEKGSEKSNFFEIYVSRDVQTGKMNGQDDEDEVVTVGSENYAFVKAYSSMKSSMTMGNEYTIYLDIFGRIFSSEVEVSSAKLAILDKYYSNSSYDNMVGQFYFTDGTTKVLEIDNTKVGMTENVIKALVYKVSGLNTSDWTSGSYSVSNVNKDKTPIENRVVEYKISSTTNKVISLTFLNPILNTANKTDAYPSSWAILAENTYRERTNAIGTVKMNSATNVIDATEYYKEWKKGEAAGYGDLVKGSLESTFVDGVDYAAMGFGTKNSDGTYPLVIVLDGQGAYTEDTKLAVVDKALTTKTNESGDEGYQIQMYYDGAETTMFVSDETTVNGKGVSESNYTSIVKKGDVIAFQVNSKGDIDTIDVVFAASTIDLNESYKDMYTESFAAMSTDFAGMITLPADAKYWTANWDDKSSSDYSTSLVYGVVTDKKDGYFQLGKVKSDTVNTYTGLVTDLDSEVKNDGDSSVANSTSTNNGGVMDISLTDATKVYVYDYSQSRKDNMLYEGTKSDIIATSIPESHITAAADGHEYILWDKTVETKTDGTTVSLKEANDIYFAFAKVVDGVATDVLVIYAE